MFFGEPKMSKFWSQPYIKVYIQFSWRDHYYSQIKQQLYWKYCFHFYYPCILTSPLDYQNNLKKISYCSQTTNYQKSEISKALFTLPETWSHSFLMSAGDIHWHKRQRQDKVGKSFTLCKWTLTLGDWLAMEMSAHAPSNVRYCSVVSEQWRTSSNQSTLKLSFLY